MPPLVEAVLEDGRWERAGLPALAEGAARAALGHLGLDPDAHAIVLLGCDDARIAALNADFRGKPAATNVLSWPSEERGAGPDGGAPAPPEGGELGDIAIAWETCAREAAKQGKPFSHHVAHLVVHATLHLLGYDHVRPADADLMEGLETGILAQMGIADPYE